VCVWVCVCVRVFVFVCMCVRVRVWNSKTSLKQFSWSERGTVHFEAMSRFDFAKNGELKFIWI